MLVTGYINLCIVSWRKRRTIRLLLYFWMYCKSSVRPLPVA